jgi:hypothetical protein
MSRGARYFKQGDVTRAVKGVVAGGVEVDRVEIEVGKIVVFVGRDRPPPDSGDDGWNGVK